MKSSSSLLWIAIELQKHKLGLGIGIELAKPQKNKIVTAATKLFHKADNSGYLTSQARSDRLRPPARYTPTERRSSSASLRLCQAAPQGRCLGQPESSHTHTCTRTQDRSQGTSRALWTEAGGRGGERPLQHSWCGSSCIVHPWWDLCNAAMQTCKTACWRRKRKALCWVKKQKKREFMEKEKRWVFFPDTAVLLSPCPQPCGLQIAPEEWHLGTHKLYAIQKVPAASCPQL